MTHAPPRGLMGKRGWRCVFGGEEPLWYSGLLFPVDPDKLGKWKEPLRALIFFFSVTKTRTSSKAVVGICAGIAFEFLKKESFLIERKGLIGMEPDLEVMG